MRFVYGTGINLNWPAWSLKSDRLLLTVILLSGGYCTCQRVFLSMIHSWPTETRHITRIFRYSLTTTTRNLVDRIQLTRSGRQPHVLVSFANWGICREKPYAPFFDIRPRNHADTDPGAWKGRGAPSLKLNTPTLRHLQRLRLRHAWQYWATLNGGVYFIESPAEWKLWIRF